MNERLEKEIKQFCKENVTGCDPIYTGSSLTHSMLPKCARHFYALALKDVKDKLNNDWHKEMPYSTAVKIMDYLEKLSK